MSVANDLNTLAEATGELTLAVQHVTSASNYLSNNSDETSLATTVSAALTSLKATQATVSAAYQALLIASGL